MTSRRGRLPVTRSGGPRTRPHLRYLAGPIPEDGQAIPVDMAQTSRGLSQPMERRATATAAEPSRMATRGSGGACPHPPAGHAPSPGDSGSAR